MSDVWERRDEGIVRLNLSPVREAERNGVRETGSNSGVSNGVQIAGSPFRRPSVAFPVARLFRVLARSQPLFELVATGKVDKRTEEFSV